MRTVQCRGQMRRGIILHAVWKEIKGRRKSLMFLLFGVTVIRCHHELFYFHRLILGSASGTGGCASAWHPRATWPRLCCSITICGIWLRSLSEMGEVAISQSHHSFGNGSYCWAMIQLLQVELLFHLCVQKIHIYISAHGIHITIYRCSRDKLCAKGDVHCSKSVSTWCLYPLLSKLDFYLGWVA